MQPMDKLQLVYQGDVCQFNAQPVAFLVVVATLRVTVVPKRSKSKWASDLYWL